MGKKWRRIGKGETIPTSSIIRPIDGGLPNITGSRVIMGQDCYYLSVDDAYDLLKGLPLETEEEAKERNEAIIIKKLIGLVKETEFLSAENRASLLDWLEKQGEQKQELLTKEKALKNYPFVEQKHVDLVAILKDYFANTPKDQQDKDWEELKHLNNFGWELIEQKPTWSEEEKKKLDRIYYILGIAADEHAYSNTCRLIGDKEAVELQDFLRSIAKPEQKPAEWSKEDEENFARVDYACIKVYGGDSYSSDWLRKFLGIHKKWKPSDEQMKVLDLAIKHSHLTTAEYDGLVKLREQLKKL